jgi:predicted transposase YdaD
MEGLHFTFVEIRKWLEFGKFDKDDPKDAWMLFFTQPEAMKQIYTPEEKAKLKDMFEAVNAWDLTQYTETELLVMHKKIDIMLTTELVAEVSFGEGLQAGIEEGKEEGKAIGIHLIREAINQIKLNPGISDEELINNYGLTPEDIKWIREL